MSDYIVSNMFNHFASEVHPWSDKFGPSSLIRVIFEKYLKGDFQPKLKQQISVKLFSKYCIIIKIVSYMSDYSKTQDA